MIDSYITEGVGEYVLSLFKGFRGVCVDIGAYHPYWLNNSWIFERIGWDTYCIEPNPNCIPELKRERKNVLEYACGNKNQDKVNLYIYKNEIVGEAGGTGLFSNPKNLQITDKWNVNEFSGKALVKVRTLDWLMENEIKKDHIDYLSIDAEKSEMDILRGTNLERWKPKIIVVENTDEDQEQRDHLAYRGYRRVNRIVFNDIYILESYYLEHIYIEGNG